jgi:protein-S-isoprenylcysteine O-methyltransferase Ste14
MKRIIPFLIALLLLGVFAHVIHAHFPSLGNQTIRVLFFVGLFLVIVLLYVASVLHTKWLKAKVKKAMKEAIEKEGASVQDDDKVA